MKSIKKDIAILIIFRRLQKGEILNLSTILELTQCSKRTCNRYIYEIKEYLSEFEPELVLIYSASKKTYLLKDAKEVVKYKYYKKKV